MFGIMRVEKRRRAAVYGLQIEANRALTDHTLRGRDFEASDIVWELTPFNMQLVRADSWGKAITAAIKDAGAEERKNSIVLLDGFYGASKEWFADKSLEEIVDFFKACLAFHEREYGKVLNAVIHFDESVPHLQVASIPLITDEKGTRLSAKEIMGSRTDYRKRQDLFYEQVSKPRGLERGEIHDPAATKKHLTVQEFKKQTVELETERLMVQNQELRKECQALLAKNQNLQELNAALTEQVEQPFLHYCMMEFIRNAKVRGENGEVKLVVDGFHSYIAHNEQELRAKWEQQFLPSFIQQDEERFREREYDLELEYEDRGR